MNEPPRCKFAPLCASRVTARQPWGEVSIFVSVDGAPKLVIEKPGHKIRTTNPLLKRLSEGRSLEVDVDCVCAEVGEGGGYAIDLPASIPVSTSDRVGTYLLIT